MQNRKTRLARLTNSVVEALENRTLLSASISGTTLNISDPGLDGTTTLSDSGTTITVQQSTTSTFADTKVTKIVYAPGFGGATLNLLSNTKPVSIIGAGVRFQLDIVQIGNNGSLAGIAAPVTITNPPSFTDLEIEGGSNKPGLTGTLTATTLSGLSPGSISFVGSQLALLDIFTNDSLNITNTATTSDAGNLTRIYSGVASPAVAATVTGTTGPLDFNVQSNGGILDIGAGSVQSIKGAISINSDSSAVCNVHIDDSADTVGRTVSIEGGYTITGLAPATIEYDGPVNASGLYVKTGLGNDTLNINGGSLDGNASPNSFDTGAGNDTVNYLAGGNFTASIFGGAGNDTFTVGDGTGIVPNDFLNYDGGTGSNTVVINDAGDTNNAFFNFSASRIQYFGNGIVNTTNVQKMSALGGAGNDTFNVDPTMTIPVLIHGGAGNDLINGGAGNDTLFGDGGDDTINGGPGNDSINGGDGNDSLNGGLGTDVITGGTGIDSIDSGDGDPVHIIADDIAPQGVSRTGEWASSTSVGGFYASDYLNDGNTDKGQSSVTWSPTLPATGSYQVYARWTAAANRSNHVPYSVTHQGVKTTVFENQQKNNGAWVLLGTYNFNAGSASVSVSNAGTTGYVIADAVRFIPVNIPHTITGNVFNDSNANGKQDAGEGPSTHGAVMYLDLNKDGILDNNEPTAVVDSNGNYTFTGLSAGTYRLRYENNVGYRQTAPAAGYQDITISGGNIIAAPFADEAFVQTPAPVAAIDAGSSTGFILNSGLAFGPDANAFDGTDSSTPFAVAGTDNDPLYYTYRYSNDEFSYQFALPNGNYNLVLWFTDPLSTAKGQNVFEVSNWGSLLLSNFDIYAAVGSKTALSKSFAITNTHGALNLAFSAIHGDAMVSAIALYPAT